MLRPFERRSKTREKMPSSKESGEVGNLERLRNSHGFKGVMTPEQQATQEHQARTKWQENEYKAKREVAEERANQPWRPKNGMQLTSEYGHRSRGDFSGAVAGTPEQAKRYWDDPNSAKDPDEFWRHYHASEAEYSSQSAEASSQNDTGTSRPMREVVELSSSDEEGEGEKVNAHAERLLKGAKNFENYKSIHMTKEEMYHAYQAKNGNKDKIALEANARLSRLKTRYDVINNNKHLSEEDFYQIWENYKVTAKRTIQSKNRQLNDSDLSDFSA